jgi:hypothetical protein
MKPGEKTWTVVLRCRECSRLFTLPKIPTDRIGMIHNDASCPHCAAKSIFVPGPNWEKESKLHQIADLIQEPASLS